MRNSYLIGCDVLGADTAPAAGLVYTDKATVTAVQKALLTRGYTLKKGADGVFGPETSSAIKALQANVGIPQTGVIDSGVLAALHVEVTKVNFEDELVEVARPKSEQKLTQAALNSIADLLNPTKPLPNSSSPSSASIPGTPPSGLPGASSNFLARPLWEGAPVKVYQAGLGTIAFAAIIGGAVAMFRTKSVPRSV